jgi:hypothetical protein
MVISVALYVGDGGREPARDRAAVLVNPRPARYRDHVSPTSFHSTPYPEEPHHVTVEPLSVISDADRALVGIETEPGYHLIEAGAVRRFCEAVGLTDPIYVDAPAAHAAGYPERPVPAAFWSAIQVPGSELRRPELGGFGSRNMNAGTEFDYLKPVYVGQTLACTAKLAALSERTGKSGHMVITVLEYTWRDESGSVVTRARLTGVRL